MGFIWDQDHVWGDTHSDEMVKNAGLKYVCEKINTLNSIGRIGAFQTLCLISRSGALIPEFCAKGVIDSILSSLHSPDLNLRLYATEILKNFTRSDKILQYVDALDLLRNMVDCFYQTDDNKIINLLLEGFMNLSEHPIIRVPRAYQESSIVHGAN